MNNIRFIQAMQIISKKHTTKLVINQAHDFIGNMGKTTFTIEIISCVPAVINDLKDGGFMLGMTEGRLMLSHYEKSVDCLQIDIIEDIY